ncbi:hypothetical protein ACBS74_003840 [Escherichia coli]
MNGGTFFGCNADSDSPSNVVESHCQADSGAVPKWGQTGAFVVVVDGMRVLVEFGSLGSQGTAHFSFHAVDLDAWFISGTGYRSHFDGVRFGLTVEEAAKAILADYLKDKRHEIKANFGFYIAACATFSGHPRHTPWLRPGRRCAARTEGVYCP